MGMSEIEFELTTPRFFYYRQRGFEALQNEAWQRSRLEAFYSFLPHTKKNAMKKPSDLYRLPGDEKEVHISEEERKRMSDLLKVAKNVDFFKGELMPTPQA